MTYKQNKWLRNDHNRTRNRTGLSRSVSCPIPGNWAWDGNALNGTPVHHRASYRHIQTLRWLRMASSLPGMVLGGLKNQKESHMWTCKHVDNWTQDQTRDLGDVRQLWYPVDHSPIHVQIGHIQCILYKIRVWGSGARLKENSIR